MYVIMTSNIIVINNYDCDINNSIDSVITWLNNNNLNVNLTKTNYIQIGIYIREHILLNINYINYNIKKNMK